MVRRIDKESRRILTFCDDLRPVQASSNRLLLALWDDELNFQGQSLLSSFCPFKTRIDKVSQHDPFQDCFRLGSRLGMLNEEGQFLQRMLTAERRATSRRCLQGLLAR